MLSLLTPREAAQTLRVSEKTLANWRSSGRYGLPFIKFGNRVLYNQTDLQFWIDFHTRLKTARPYLRIPKQLKAIKKMLMQK